jgi:glycosyltransferase 2 family protein
VRFPWKTVLGFALSAALLYWVLHNVNWSDVGATLRASDFTLWALAIISSQLIFVLRVLRWKPILHSIAPDVGFGKLWRATTIGMMVNNVVIPSRLGELARAYALAREEPRVPFSAGLGSLAVDRSFDAVVVLGLILVALLDPHLSASIPVKGDRTLGTSIAFVGAGVVVLFAVLYAGVFAPERFEAVGGALTKKIAPKFEQQVRQLARSFTRGLGVLRDPGRFVAVFLWALAHWVLNAGAMWLSFKAMHLDVPLTAAFLVQGLIVIGAAAPQMPAYFGTFEIASRISLGAYAIGQPQAVAWALSYHILTLIPITLIGLWDAGRLGISIGELRRAPSAAAGK